MLFRYLLKTGSSNEKIITQSSINENIIRSTQGSPQMDPRDALPRAVAYSEADAQCDQLFDVVGRTSIVGSMPIYSTVNLVRPSMSSVYHTSRVHSCRTHCDDRRAAAKFSLVQSWGKSSRGRCYYFCRYLMFVKT